MNNVVKYVDVILPLPVEGFFTYKSDSGISIDIGQRVVVQFGRRKLYTAIVVKVYEMQSHETFKDILAILDEKPIVNLKQIELWSWIAEYYMCKLGEVMNAALPSSFKLASESSISIHPNFDGDLDGLNKDESIIIHLLIDKEEVLVHDLAPIIRKNIFLILNEMISNEVILIKENLHDKYKEKIISFIELGTKDLQQKITFKQDLLYNKFLSLKKLYPKRRWKISALLKEANSTRSVLNSLIKKGILRKEYNSISRLLLSYNDTIPSNNLSKVQLKAFHQIKEGFKDKNICLLHGVTSSGKTEIYIKLIEEQLIKGKQVLYLLPEIALTSQIINRLRRHFGNKVGVSHSHLNNSERVEVWRAVKESNNEKVSFPIIIGARSALFLPFDNLGLIIVDEEHDPSYKQKQPSPRYHARDTAIYLAKIHSAILLLGSATPSIESYYNAKEKKYNLVRLNKRYGDMILPKIECVDIRKEYSKKRMQYSFSLQLINHIRDAVDDGRQVILFQNRRGYSPVLSCGSCSFTPQCRSCDVSLTFHKWKRELKCHYCGYTIDIPEICIKCSSNEFNSKGLGTEQIQESLGLLFPKFKVARMDYDTTRKKFSHQEIIRDFEQGIIDILVGTQMITKGLDFDNVALVGILNADNMLYYPDFRAYERAFQLMMQVAGRAGRKKVKGKVLIQTYDDNHKILQLIKKHDFGSFFMNQLHERKLFNYPPYSRIIGITLKHKDRNKLDQASNQLASQLYKSFKNRVLGPEYPYISRIRNYYHKDILIKIEQKSSLHKAKQILNMILDKLRKRKDFRSIRIILDVDKI